MPLKSIIFVCEQRSDCNAPSDIVGVAEHQGYPQFMGNPSLKLWVTLVICNSDPTDDFSLLSRLRALG